MATVKVTPPVADAVRAERRARGWSVVQAARKADIDRATWDRIEDGLTVHDTKLAKVERCLGLTLVGDVAPGPSEIRAASDSLLLAELLRRAAEREATG